MCLVNSIAKQYQDRGIDYDDLLLEGVKGLRKALDRFDSKHGTKFSTYAYYWISFYIKSALAHQSSAISLPHHTYRLAIKIKCTIDRLSSLGIIPTDEAIAKELKINMETLAICRKAVALVERDETKKITEDKQQSTTMFDESTWEVIKDDAVDGADDNTAHLLSSSPLPNAVTNLQNNEIHDALHDALRRLPKSESKAIYERLGLQDIIPTYNIANDEKTLPSYKSNKEVDPKTLYLKGIRRLRRLLNDKKYPEFKYLESILLNSVDGYIEKKSTRKEKAISNLL